LGKSTEKRPKPRTPKKRIANDAAAIRVLGDLRTFFAEHASKDAPQDPMSSAHDVVNALLHGLAKSPAMLARLATASRAMLAAETRDFSDHAKALSWDGPTSPFPRPGSERSDAARVMRDGIHEVLVEASAGEGDAFERARDAGDLAARWVTQILFGGPLGSGLRNNAEQSDSGEARAAQAARAALEKMTLSEWREIGSAETLVRACLRAYGAEERVVESLFSTDRA